MCGKKSYPSIFEVEKKVDLFLGKVRNGFSQEYQSIRVSELGSQRCGNFAVNEELPFLKF